MEYQRFITPETKPFDPLELARETEQITCQGDKRRYTAFYSVPVYRGIATGYAVGCCLRCYYCWSDRSRDFPEAYGDFYSPSEVFAALSKAAGERIKYGPPAWRGLPIRRLRLSGCEPTIGKEHLLSLMEWVEPSEFPLFILETNGILFGADRDYVQRLAKFSKLHVRVSLKAGTPEGFTRRTGAMGDSYELPFKALEHLLQARVSCHAAAMTDPRVMMTEERAMLIRKLQGINQDLARNLEEEKIDPYETTKERLKAAKVTIKW